jgi:hypothetical protein
MAAELWWFKFRADDLAWKFQKVDPVGLMVLVGWGWKNREARLMDGEWRTS